MKQFVTEKQLKELTKTQYNNLWHWYVVHDYSDIEKKDDWSIEVLPINLSIGQMIEFLLEHNYEFNIEKLNEVDLNYKPKNNWCDALWEAVREVLKLEDK